MNRDDPAVQLSAYQWDHLADVIGVVRAPRTTAAAIIEATGAAETTVREALQCLTESGHVAPYDGTDGQSHYIATDLGRKAIVWRRTHQGDWDTSQQRRAS